jgi:hypothetical protein
MYADQLIGSDNVDVVDAPVIGADKVSALAVAGAADVDIASRNRDIISNNGFVCLLANIF